jgi:hypothetical protein
VNPSNPPRTARELLERVREYGPGVEDGDLVFETEPPELDAALRVLHTGVRALLTGRRWWGSTPCTNWSASRPGARAKPFRPRP